MATLATKIKLYCEANSKTIDFINDVRLANDGDGNIYIKKWNVEGLTQPTDSQLASYETAGNTKETLDAVLTKRRKEYLSYNEQLDKLWHDINDGKFGDTAKTGTWYTHIKSVKDANSKG
jgi:hypothetical protein|tara:strand:+ start:644 stop:1003 length:360 start_codon:yes stop_codon:yes gene_type:complete